MHWRLKRRNMPNNVNHSKLDQVVLKQAMQNKIPPWSKSEDWHLPLIIVQYKQTNTNIFLHPGLVPVENTEFVIHNENKTAKGCDFTLLSDIRTGSSKNTTITLHDTPLFIKPFLGLAFLQLLSLHMVGFIL